MAKHLHPRAAVFEESDNGRQMGGIGSRNSHEQRADGLLLHMIDAAMNKPERAGHAGAQFGQQRATRGFSGYIDPEDRFGALARG